MALLTQEGGSPARDVYPEVSKRWGVRTRVINPEDYPTEFVDGDPKKKRIYTDRVLLPKTGKSWKEYSFELKNPPNRNLIKLEFRTKGTYLDLEWLQVPQ